MDRDRYTKTHTGTLGHTQRHTDKHSAHRQTDTGHRQGSEVSTARNPTLAEGSILLML